MRTSALLSSLVLAATLVCHPAFAAEQEASLPAALTMLRAGKAADAAAMLETVVQREPANARAWRALGAASKQVKSYPRALAAFRRAATLDPSNPGPLYNIGAIYALQGKPAQAFTWLRKAKNSHRLDMTQIDGDADLASLKGDPRFQKLHPVRADFDHPFVEPVTIIREWDGEAANDQFGWIARVVGDVDGDGIVDVVTSAPGHNGGATGAGRIYLYSTGSGKLLWTADGQPGDTLGSGVEGAGDTNGDGIPDVIASAPASSRAFVYSGKDGHVLLTLHGESQTDNFGTHVAGVGDVDGDGHADVIVGAPLNDAGGKGAGRAYVYSGSDGHLLLTLTGQHEGDHFGSSVSGWSDHDRMRLVVGAGAGGPEHTGSIYVYDALSTTPKFVMAADATGAALGAMFVTVPGDLNGDGVPDIYASDWLNRAKGPSTGRVYVASGADGKPLLTLTGENPGDGFGTSSSAAGDVDGDGAADLIVGAWQYAGAAISGGRAYLYSGKDGRLLRTFTCRTPGDTFGFDAVGLGDVDGDGTVDLLITSGWSGVHGFHSGRVFVISSGVK